jgi:hypothetical protein
MRTILKVGAIMLAGGALLYPSRSAEACHRCHRKAARSSPYSAPSTGYGYSTYGYQSTPYCYGVYPGGRTGGSSEDSVASKPAKPRTLEERVASLEGDVKHIQSDVAAIRKLLEERLRKP